MPIPASPKSVRTACSMRPFGRASRRQVETDSRDICHAPMLGPPPPPPPPKTRRRLRGSRRRRMHSRIYELPVTLRAPPAAPDGAGGGDDAGGANGHAAWSLINPRAQPCQPPDRVVDTARDAG